MKHYFLVGFLLLSIVSFSQKHKGIKLKNGSWVSELKINDHDILPFNMVVNKGNQFVVINGDEQIELNAPIFQGDSVIVKFPFFNSHLVIHNYTKKNIAGYWQNLNKGEYYKIPFAANWKKHPVRFDVANKPVKSFDPSGRWKVIFEPNTEYAYPAVGVFNNKSENGLTGTFLTETGDYRFLEGNVYRDSVFLSCFDGSHAFLFKACYNNDSLKGSFFSGSHWSCEWNGIKDPDFELANPEELTFIKKGEEVKFQFKTLNGDLFSYPNEGLKDKVVIIQIMGTWCPNCLDETTYFKELYNKYHQQGLEIISIGYEAGQSFEDYASNIHRLKQKLNLDFTFLVGGQANKGQASSDFSFLNAIISFPTSIFIGKDGVIKRIHTGFNGPGTGTYYIDYKSRTEDLIERLINQ